MAKKIVTNEFVVMGEISKDIASYTPTPSCGYYNILNFICKLLNDWYDYRYIEGIVIKKTSDFVSKYVPMMLLSGILVSLLTAAFVGLFAW